MSRLKLNSFVLAISVLALTSCATLIEGSSQEVTFEAKGATNVMCELKTKGGELAYKVYPPQRIWLKRSRVNMMADCFAPGNRNKKFVISTGVEPWTAANVTNAGTGVAWDAYSRAFFKYPDVIVIDMSDTTATPSLPPGYHNGDGLPPSEAGIENMGPKKNELIGDRYDNQVRNRAYEQYARDQEFEVEREERKSMYDPGVKK